MVCPPVLSCNNLKLHQTLEEKNIYIQENIMPLLTFNPGLTFTGFRTTRPWICNEIFKSPNPSYVVILLTGRREG